MIFELLKTSGKTIDHINYMSHTVSSYGDNIYIVEISDLDELMELVKKNGACVIGNPGI